MLKNYFKIALRNLFKRKAFTIINVLGLATGMAVCLLIVLFINGELSYDQHHQKGDNIYRVVLDRNYPGRSSAYSIIPQSIGPAMQTEFPEVVACSRVFNFNGGGNGNFFMRVGEKIFEESSVLSADSNFFQVFTGKFLAGNINTAMHPPNSAVLNEATAIKMYGSVQAALGKQFETDGDQDQNNTFIITGVCADWPATSHFTFNVLLSVTGFPFIRIPNYVNFSAHTYLVLASGGNPKTLEAKFPGIVDKYVSGEIERLFGQSFKDFQTAGNGYDYSLQALKEIHLTSNREAELSTNGNKTSVYIFAIIAVFILFLACINFINLSTARSVERAKEVGIRKTFGSGKETLVTQFLVESVLLALIALLIAFALMFLLLPLFNQLSGRHLAMIYLFQPAILISVLSRQLVMVCRCLRVGLQNLHKFLFCKASLFHSCTKFVKELFEVILLQLLNIVVFQLFANLLYLLRKTFLKVSSPTCRHSMPLFCSGLIYLNYYSFHSLKYFNLNVQKITPY